MRTIEARVSRRQGPQTAPANPLSQRPVLRPLAHLAALAAITAAFLAPASAWGAAGDPPGGWQASYYPNRSLQGAPVLTRSDPAIDFDWGAGAPGPGLPADDFSVRWTADVPFATSCRGVRLVSNDGMRVSVAGREVLSFWFDQFPSERVTSLCPGPGTHTVTVEYYEGAGTARALFQLEAQTPPPGATATRTPTFTPSPAPTVSPPAGPGGLNGQYFSGRGLGSPVLTRSDPAIDFDWGAGAPGPGLPADDFSVRWTGEVLAETAGPYTFTVTSNDGARLWVAGQLLVDVWTDGVHDSSGTVQLDAGRWYPLTLEYFEGLGTARVRLAYTPPGGPPQTVPSARLRGTAAPPGPGSPTATRTPTSAPTAAPTQAPPPTATAAGPGAPTGAPTLLSRHEIRGPLPEARNLAYRPRQFGAGLAVDDASWGDQRVDNPGPYAGWDVLAMPNEGITRVADRADWLALGLNRPARLAVVWRCCEIPTGWLSGWEPGPEVVVNGAPLPTYTRRVGAGEVILGGVYDPGAVPGPHATRDSYWVLLGEEDGRPSAAPAVPAGREAPRPNETCPVWVHDQYSATGPDNRRYATWHPQIDPVYWCYFRHDHGSDPARFSPSYRPLYGYASTAAGSDEPHPGFKSYVFDDGGGRRWLLSQHFGTGSVDRACVRFHDVAVAVAAAGSGEVLADLQFMGDFGKAVVNANGEPLTPSRCPGQAAASNADGSRGERQLPVLTRGAIGYEPWRLDEHRTILGLTGGLTFNTPDAVVMCNDVICDRPIPTGSTGTLRFFTYSRGFGITAGGLSGTFYTDPYGRAPSAAGQPGAVRQYVRPGLSVTVPYFGDNQTCHSSDPWGGLYRCDATLAQGLPAALENAIQAPN